MEHRCKLLISAMVLEAAVLIAVGLYSVHAADIRPHEYDEIVFSVTDTPAPIDQAPETDDPADAEDTEEYEEYVEYDVEEYVPEYGGEYSMSTEQFKHQGVVYYGGFRFTWYSQRVLPGGGLYELNNNGRHVEDGFIMDGDGYIAVASSDYGIGTVVDTPWGEAKVYDTGCSSGTIDVYTDF